MSSKHRIPTRPLTFRRTRNLIGAAALLVAVTGWAIGYRATSRMAETAERAARSQDTIVTIRGMVVELSRASAAARNVRITADQRLADVRSAAAGYRREMGRLRQLMDDQPDQMSRLDAIEQLVKPRLTAAESAAAGIAPPTPSGPAAVPMVTAIDGPLGELEAREQSLADRHAAEARSRARAVLLVRALNAIVTILTICGAFLLFNRDVSRQERDDARLREALKDADAASDAKTHFLATVSHEIRTPLNAVSGMSELLLETRLDPEQTEFARAVHNNADALAMLIGDLLDSSRIEAGQVFLESTPFDLRELVEGVAELLTVRAEAKGVELVVDVPPATPRGLIGDRTRLRQVLMNLVGNAVKFTEQGDVTIRARVEPASDGRVRVRLAVIDTGIGIPLEAQSRIFERFVQAERSTARRYGGTGLGLNISRSLIELMGGRLTLESAPGRGSVFEADLRLPLAPAQPPADVGAASLEGVDMLLVQQNAALRRVNEDLLRFAGASVRTAGTAAETYQQIAQQVPGVIAVGERLPDSTGVDLAKQVWHDRYGATPAVGVVLMCSLRARAAGNVGSYGITGCVYKPVKQERLVRAVREAARLETEPVERVRDETTKNAARPSARPRILLVEDNRDNWAREMRILTASGYDVDLAENGLDAVASASSRDYGLVLMDVAMPGFDGIEATRRIRAREVEAGGRVPIVALTAHAMDSVRQDALTAGMNDYVTKPFEKQQLLDICAKWIDPRPLLLVADDTPDNQLLVASYLRGDSYRLTFVANGQEAVAAFERQRPALVLLDMNMPVMDGYEAARTIRRLPGGEKVPIVALTSHDGPQESARCLAAGCTEFLSKPIRRSELLAHVAGLLDSQNDSGSPGDSATSMVTLPPARETAERLHRQLAVRDFNGVAALATSIGAAARAQQSTELAAVSEELAGAARLEDVERSSWWCEQFLARLRESSPPAGDAAPTQRRGANPLDALARLATQILGVPAAAVTLFGDERVRIAGASGLPPELDLTNGFPRSTSLRRLVVEQQSALVVEDARTHPVLADGLLVTSYGIAALAGVPLADARGTIVGTFFAMDQRPRRWPPRDVAMLEEIAAVAMCLLDRDGVAAPSASGCDDVLVADDDIVDLLPEYVAQRRRDVTMLRQDLERGDLGAVAVLGHKMKGSGSGYGLPFVSRLGGEIEGVARAGDAGAIRPLIDDLDRRLGALRIRSASGRVSMEL